MPTPLVIGFGGATKTGKTSISTAVAVELQCGWGSFGDFIRSKAISSATPSPTRAELQVIGETFVATRCGELCSAVLAQAFWKPGAAAVLDGVRHAKVLRTLNELIAPQR